MSTNAAIVPPEIAPSLTACAPRQTSRVMPPKTSRITIAVIAARMMTRRRATEKVRSTASRKRACSRSSWLNPWTIFIADSTSVTIAPISATRSWLVRETLRRRRPNSVIGITMAGISRNSPMVRPGTSQNR